MAETPKKDRCWMCRGRGKMRQWTDTPTGVQHRLIPCPSCGGSGISPLAGCHPSFAEFFRKYLAALPPQQRCSMIPVARSPVEALSSSRLPVSPKGTHDLCRVEDYDRAAEDKELLDGIARERGAE